MSLLAAIAFGVAAFAAFVGALALHGEDAHKRAAALWMVFVACVWTFVYGTLHADDYYRAEADKWRDGIQVRADGTAVIARLDGCGVWARAVDASLAAAGWRILTGRDSAELVLVRCKIPERPPVDEDATLKERKRIKADAMREAAK